MPCVAKVVQRSNRLEYSIIYQVHATSTLASIIYQVPGMPVRYYEYLLPFLLRVNLFIFEGEVPPPPPPPAETTLT